jgi:hypothetical protein
MRIGIMAVSVCLLCLAALPARAQSVSVDSLVASVRQTLADCDSQIVELTFVATLRERELRDDGPIKKEKLSKSRFYVRGEASSEVLEAMWEDSQPISESKLKDEREKREKERAKRQKKRNDRDEGDDSRSATVMEPFKPEHVNDYTFPDAVSDSVGDIACWKITVAPTRDDEDLVKGYAWIEQGTGRAVREEYDMANRPGPVKDFGIVMEHSPILDRCAFPDLFRLHVRGKALLLIKFNVDVELQFDSVQVNPGLPDSLFATPAE